MELVKLLNQVDCVWANCEVPFINPDEVYPEYRDDFVIGCEPWGADELKFMGIDFVGLANNHATDYGPAGFYSTLKNLNRVGIAYAGAGKDLDAASRPGYLDIDDARIGQVSCTFWYPKGSEASPHHPYQKGRHGVNPIKVEEHFVITQESYDNLIQIDKEIYTYFGDPEPKEKKKEIRIMDITFHPGEKTFYYNKSDENDLKRVLESVAIARRNSRVVIVIFHEHRGGRNYEKPSSHIEEFARACIDAGADVVVGTGPHQLFGIEIYKKKPIFYSLGNFFFQTGSYGAYPPENCKMLKLPLDTRDVKIIEEETLKQYPYFAKDPIYETVVPVITFIDQNKVAEIILYPVAISKTGEVPFYLEGTPFMADEKKGKIIVDKLIKMSTDYHTRIDYKNRCGIVLID